ncbi:MAG: HEAT repeat domain-containing protein [Deltaproteobacteria bacterium]|nr:HEAT repeat domain-containing protein [Deltaproteobacteria bacterium]
MRLILASPFARSLTAVLVVSLAEVAGCSSGPAPGEEAAFYGAQLDASTRKERTTAMTKIAALKDIKGAMPFLYKALKSKNKDVRPKSAMLVGKHGDASSVPALVDGLDFKARSTATSEDKMAAVANERIAKALAKLGKGDDEKVVEALKKLMNMPQLEVQLAGLQALGGLKAQSAIDDLIYVAEAHENNFMMKNAIIALGNLGNPKAVPVLMRNMFFERNVSFYIESSYSLFQLGKPSIDPLLEVFHNKYEPIEDLHIEKGVQKAKAIQVLTDIGGDKRIEAVILEAAKISPDDTANSLARIWSQQQLGRLGLQAGKATLLSKWDDIDQSKSEHSLNGLVQLGAKDKAAGLLAMTTYNGFVRQCMKLDSRNKKSTCEAASSQVRPARVLPASRLAPGSSLKTFEQMLKEEKGRKDGKNKKLVKAIEEGIKRVQAAAECDGKGKACWVKMLDDKEPLKRERAGYELLWLNDKSTAEAQRKLLADKDNEVRFTGILYAWRTLDKEALPLIKETLKKEKGKTQYVRINQDLRRLVVKLERGY